MKQSEYKQLEQSITPKPNLLKNCIKAFLVGGFICLIGQVIAIFFMINFE